jgi:hypothetical protein
VEAVRSSFYAAWSRAVPLQPNEFPELGASITMAFHPKVKYLAEGKRLPREVPQGSLETSPNRSVKTVRQLLRLTGDRPHRRGARRPESGGGDPQARVKTRGLDLVPRRGPGTVEARAGPGEGCPHPTPRPLEDRALAMDRRAPPLWAGLVTSSPPAFVRPTFSSRPR